MTSFRKQLVRGIVATAVVASTLAVGAPVFAAKSGDTCTIRDAYKIAKVGTSYIRCEIVPGTSLHSADPKKKAAFKWKTLTGKTAEAQWVMSSAKNASIRIDGSSTVGPLATVAAKYFETATKSAMARRASKSPSVLPAQVAVSKSSAVVKPISRTLHGQSSRQKRQFVRRTALRLLRFRLPTTVLHSS